MSGAPFARSSSINTTCRNILRTAPAPLPPVYSSSLRDLVLQLLARDPAARASVGDILAMARLQTPQIDARSNSISVGRHGAAQTAQRNGDELHGAGSGKAAACRGAAKSANTNGKQLEGTGFGDANFTTPTALGNVSTATDSFPPAAAALPTWRLDTHNAAENDHGAGAAGGQAKQPRRRWSARSLKGLTAERPPSAGARDTMYPEHPAAQWHTVQGQPAQQAQPQQIARRLARSFLCSLRSL